MNERLQAGENRLGLSSGQVESIIKATKRWNKQLDLSQESQALEGLRISKRTPGQTGAPYSLQDVSPPTGQSDSGKNADDVQKDVEKKADLGGYWDVIKEIAKDHPLVAGILAVVGLVAVVALAVQGSVWFGQAWILLIVVVVVAFVAIALAAAYPVLHGKVLSPARAYALALKTRDECNAAETPPPRLRIRKGGWEVYLACTSAPKVRKFLVSFGTDVIPLGPTTPTSA